LNFEQLGLLVDWCEKRNWENRLWLEKQTDTHANNTENTTTATSRPVFMMVAVSDTVPVSVWHDGGIYSSECLLLSTVARLL